MTNELKSLTLNQKKYDSFVDETARTAASNCVPTPSGSAEVGQFLTVKAVDENGSPTEWATAANEPTVADGSITEAKLAPELVKELYAFETIIDEDAGIELEWTEGYAWNTQGGAWKEFEEYASTQYFDVEPNTLPQITNPELLFESPSHLISLRNDGTYVGYWTQNKYYNSDRIQVATLNFNEAAFCIQRETTDYTQVRLVGGETTEEVVKYSRMDKLEEKTEILKNQIAIVESRQGKKYYLFGDSITYWDSRTSWYDDSVYMIAYPSYIRDVLNANIVNCGVAGNNANQITSRLKGTNLTDAYAVTYMAGANDVQQGVSIETYTSDLEEAVEYVCTNYPAVKFYFLAPLYTDRGDIKPYAEAMQSVADKYSVPILRWDKVSQINEFNKGYYTVEGLHPNNIGHKVMADTLIPFLKNN